MDSFDNLAGVAVHYDRYPAASGFGYGTRGKAKTFWAEKRFLTELDDMFKELFAVVPSRFGAPEVITSAGAYVSKPGYHGLGRAFDLDGIFFAKREFVTLNFPADPFFYIGVEAIIRKHFGTVLNYDYDLAHRDHFHIDNGSNVGWQQYSKSRVSFVQNCAAHCFGIPIAVDGVFGPETGGAIRQMLGILKLTRLSDRATWGRFLDEVARRAFGYA